MTKPLILTESDIPRVREMAARMTKTDVSAALGVSRNTLYRFLDRHGLEDLIFATRETRALTNDEVKSIVESHDSIKAAARQHDIGYRALYSRYCRALGTKSTGRCKRGQKDYGVTRVAGFAIPAGVR